MKKINIYLNFPGNSEEALNFYKEIFGGEISLMRYKEMPEVENLSEEDLEKIMHGSLNLGDSILMASDSIEALGHKLGIGNNFYLNISAESKEEADELFKKLSEGGKVEMPMEDSFWGDYFGMLKDKFSIQWMVGYQYPKNK